jgi:hypothetical protein
MLIEKKPEYGQRGPVRRFARLSKNFVVNGDLAKVVKEHGLNGRDLYVLIALLAEAQRRDTRTIQFPSTYAILKLLAWSDRGGDYDALESALAKWIGVEISIERFFVSRRATTGSIDDFVELYGKGGKMSRRGSYFPMHFPKVIDVAADDGQICVSFPLDFWEANSKSLGRFAKAYPGVIKQLRYPADILLFLLLDSFDGMQRIGMEALCAKIGLSARSRPWVKRRLAVALARINSETNEIYKIEVTDGDVVHIWRDDLPAKAKKAMQGKGAG